jgi:hypothetical protein
MGITRAEIRAGDVLRRIPGEPMPHRRAFSPAHPAALYKLCPFAFSPSTDTVPALPLNI